jgi:hypothetical protein
VSSLAISYTGCQYKINVGYRFLTGWFTKKITNTQCQVHFSHQLAGGHPIDPEEADDELDADQVHKEWKGYYEHRKRKWKENTK